MGETLYYCNQTNAGLSLLAKIIATGGKPNFNRAEIGSGAPENSGDILYMNALINKKHDLQVKKSFIGDTNTVKIATVLDSSQVEEGFEAKELGLYLMDDLSGEEVLFSYTYFVQGDYMPPGYLIRKTFEYTLDTAISSTANITIVTPGEAYVTERDLRGHDSDPNAHKNLIELSESESPEFGCKVHYKILAKLTKWLNSTTGDITFPNPVHAFLQAGDGKVDGLSLQLDNEEIHSGYAVTSW